MADDLSISVCPFMNGQADVIISQPSTGRGVTISTDRHGLTEEDLAFLNEVAPSCVMTQYVLAPPRR